MRWGVLVLGLARISAFLGSSVSDDHHERLVWLRRCLRIHEINGLSLKQIFEGRSDVRHRLTLLSGEIVFCLFPFRATNFLLVHVC